MKEKLAAIDESSIEELQRIKAEQEVILERLDLMEEKRGAVSEEVYERVHRDYEGRMEGLEAQAGPLKEQARGEYGVLKIVAVEIESLLKTAEMDREELQLRHDLGEFSDEAFGAQLEEHEAQVAGHQDDLSEAHALKERFLSAFHTEEELEEGSQSGLAEETLESESEPFGDEEIAEELDFPGGPPPLPDNGEQVFETPDTDPAVEAEEAAPVAMEAEEIPEQTAAISLQSPVPEGATMILRWPKLLFQTEGGNFEEHTVVGGSTILGSGSACDIMVSGIKVAERHAEITLAEDGHIIRDLESSVGTLINGVEITEWNLSDGDSIQLGEVVLIYKD